MKKICVIGSLNIDIVATVNSFPKTGESVISNDFSILVGGGKGANQAVALGKLGANVSMVGKLGDSFYGMEYLDVLKNNNVDCSLIGIEPNTMTGSAIIAIDNNHDNILIANPGANAKFSKKYIDEHWDTISQSDYFLLQQEIPDETNAYVAKKLFDLGKIIILDPAPAKDVGKAIFKYCDFVTPNETELEKYTGIEVKTKDDFYNAGNIMINMGAKVVIAKAGKHGAYYIQKNSIDFIPSYIVDAKDPTAAGDCFNAGFAYSLSKGVDIIHAIKFAHAVGGIATTAIGAQSAMPTLNIVENFLKTAKTYKQNNI